MQSEYFEMFFFFECSGYYTLKCSMCLAFLWASENWKTRGERENCGGDKYLAKFERSSNSQAR